MIAALCATLCVLVIWRDARGWLERLVAHHTRPVWTAAASDEVSEETVPVDIVRTAREWGSEWAAEGEIARARELYADLKDWSLVRDMLNVERQNALANTPGASL